MSTDHTARTVKSAEELDELPVGSVIRDAHGWVFVLLDDSSLTESDEPVWKSPGWWTLDVHFPATVLYPPAPS